jgi:hypothetical protein
MAVLTTLAQLEQVQSAITAVMSGQSYSVGDVSFTRANLAALQVRETAMEQRGGRRIRPNFSNGI